MKQGVPRHPKTLALRAALGCPLREAIGYLNLLWEFTVEYAELGDIGRWPDDVIEQACDWPGPKGELVEAFVRSGWLDACACHRLIVHDWADHAPRWVKQKAKEAGVSSLRRCATVAPEVAPEVASVVAPEVAASSPAQAPKVASAERTVASTVPHAPSVAPVVAPVVASEVDPLRARQTRARVPGLTTSNDVLSNEVTPRLDVTQPGHAGGPAADRTVAFAPSDPEQPRAPDAPSAVGDLAAAELAELQARRAARWIVRRDGRNGLDAAAIADVQARLTPAEVEAALAEQAKDQEERAAASRKARTVEAMRHEPARAGARRR